jgi:hypothetical protein
VGFAFHIAPRNEYDSGWVFWAGDEPQEYIDDSRNTAVCPMLTFLEMDETLREVVRHPVGTAWERTEDGLDWREVHGFVSPDGSLKP